jgi:hypothetical protein
MSKCFQLSAMAGALTMVMSVGVMAVGLPSDSGKFVGWSVNGGDVDETTGGICASGVDTGFTCSVVAEGKGFKQINVTEVADASSGTSYIMTVVTDQTATGTSGVDLAFSDVSFVKMKLTLGGPTAAEESGITAHQEIIENGGGFTSSSDINTGWADQGINVAISQSLTDNATVDFAGDNFTSSFEYRSQNLADGTRTGFEMAIDQVAGLGTGNTNTDKSDIQAFALREKQGSMLTTSRASTDPLMIDTADANGVSWDAYDATANVSDDIKAIWIGQQINLGTGSTNGSLGSSFGYLSFQNVADSAQAVESGFGFSDVNSGSAWKWDAAFNVTADDQLTPDVGPELVLLVAP